MAGALENPLRPYNFRSAANATLPKIHLKRTYETNLTKPRQTGVCSRASQSSNYSHMQRDQCNTLGRLETDGWRWRVHARIHVNKRHYFLSFPFLPISSAFGRGRCLVRAGQNTKHKTILSTDATLLTTRHHTVTPAKQHSTLTRTHTDRHTNRRHSAHARARAQLTVHLYMHTYVPRFPLLHRLLLGCRIRVYPGDALSLLPRPLPASRPVPPLFRQPTPQLASHGLSESWKRDTYTHTCT